MEKKKSSTYRIAIVGGCLSSHGGGMPRSMAQQARNLATVGCDVTFFSGFNKLYPFTPAELNIESIPTHVSRLWGPDLYGFPPGALIQLWKQAKGFDVIHLNAAWNLTTFAAGLIAHIRNVPYIISCRSHYGDYHFSRMPLLKKLLFNTLERINIKNAYALHVTADWEEKTSWRAVRLAKRIIKIPNPVNLDDFENPPTQAEGRRHLGLDPEGFHVVHLGRLGKQKNLPFLVQAFHKAQLGENARLLLVGPPEPAEKKKLQALAERMGIEKQVAFIDFAKGRERCHWLAAADLFALPSHDENFCIAAIEAVAAGTHCLLSPHVGAIEFLPTQSTHVCKLDMEPWIKALRELKFSGCPCFNPPETVLTTFSAESISKLWLAEYFFIGETQSNG